MNRTAKTIAYVVLIAAACMLGMKTLHVYRSLMHPAPREEVDPGEAQEARNTASPKPASAATNLTLTPAATNASRVELGTNAARLATNQPSAATGAVQAFAVSTGKVAKVKRAATEPATGPSFATLLGYAAALFGTMLILSLLLANDLSQLVAHRFVSLLFNDEGEENKPPEYEKAEQAAMDGQPLEAIRMMRDYYKKNPRKVYVAMRIAEIYEKELGSHLAAALEYEEVLKYRLPPEQWGQTAIHLANLYSGKLGKPEKALQLLRKIDADYGDTAAAVKARARLSQLDGGMSESNETPEAAPAPSPTPSATQEEPPSNLPKGFRPKK
jgi:hypothetical protein